MAQNFSQRLMMQTVIDVRMMAAADLPVVLETQSVCYTEVCEQRRRCLAGRSTRTSML